MQNLPAEINIKFHPYLKKTNKSFWTMEMYKYVFGVFRDDDFYVKSSKSNIFELNNRRTIFFLFFFFNTYSNRSILLLSYKLILIYIYSQEGCQ